MKFLPNLKNRDLTALILASTIFATSALATTAHAAKLYKWVDSNGRISYQDKPPPENAKVLEETTLKSKNRSSAKKAETAVTVDVYTTKDCSSCAKMIKELKELGVSYNEKDLQDHREIQNKIIAETNSLNVPALFIAGKLVSINYSNDLQFELKKAGYKFPTGADKPKPEPESTDTKKDDEKPVTE